MGNMKRDLKGVRPAPQSVATPFGGKEKNDNKGVCRSEPWGWHGLNAASSSVTELLQTLRWCRSCFLQATNSEAEFHVQDVYKRLFFWNWELRKGEESRSGQRVELDSGNLVPIELWDWKSDLFQVESAGPVFTPTFTPATGCGYCLRGLGGSCDIKSIPSGVDRWRDYSVPKRQDKPFLIRRPGQHISCMP